jgi:hypothetical protein
MPLSLQRSLAIARLARMLYDYLPGSGSSLWHGHVSFGSVAKDVGVGDFWEAGSKEPAITRLLERTLERRPQLFESLVIAIVRAGIAYRERNGRPLSREDVDELNRAIQEVGFKFPDLWNVTFLTSLPTRNSANTDVGSTGRSVVDRSAEFSELKSSFMELNAQADRQRAGLELEHLLNALFTLDDLAPREPFRVTGEQIDGSFALDGQVYLLEAKWWRQQLSEAELLVFHGKVAGKSVFTRGVLFALNGASPAAQDAITRGKQANFVIVDGYDLLQVLSQYVELPELLRAKIRRLAEEGRVFVSARELAF